ncbi:DivIVA domain-containing protein [Mycobacterium sp.]|uniref:DivIVA domain-containing protein n=1 Tax=Mycobacterium sp. TaxID=1785 RepID=UPI003BA8C035
MALVLLYLVVLVLAAIVLFSIASLLFGRGERLPPLPRATTATALPTSGVTGADVDAVKFTQVVRGYKTSEVDWVLDRLGRELEVLRGRLEAIQAPSVVGIQTKVDSLEVANHPDATVGADVEALRESQ